MPGQNNAVHVCCVVGFLGCLVSSSRQPLSSPDSGSFGWSVLAESASVPACVGVDLQLKLRSQTGQTEQALVQRLLRALQQRFQLVLLETCIESTIQTSSGMLRLSGA